MSLGTNLFSVFSCGGSFCNCADSICSNSTCEVWEGWMLAIWAIGFLDWLHASCMTILIGSMLANQHVVSEGRNTVCTLFFYILRSVISCFHVLEYWHETRLIVSRASAEHIRYCGVGSTSKRYVQCNFSAEQIRQEVLEKIIREPHVFHRAHGLQPCSETFSHFRLTCDSHSIQYSKQQDLQLCRPGRFFMKVEARDAPCSFLEQKVNDLPGT